MGTNEQVFDELQSKINHLTLLLCNVCKKAEREDFIIPSDVNLWWDSYKQTENKDTNLEPLEKFVEGIVKHLTDKYKLNIDTVFDLIADYEDYKQEYLNK